MIFEEKENRGVITFSWFMVFILLMTAVELQAGWLLDIDHNIQDFMTISASSHMAQIFQVITFFGSPEVVLAVSLAIVIYLIIKKERVSALWITFTVLGGYALAYTIKNLVQRIRPEHIIGTARGYSFPSGHSFGTTILVFVLICIIGKKIGRIENRFLLNSLSIVALFVLLTSRIYLRSHYPSDVVGSVILAIAWWNFSVLLYLRFYNTAHKVLYSSKKTAGDI